MNLPNTAAHLALAAVVIYRCAVEGVTVFADRPCQPTAAAYEPDTSRVTTYSPPPVSPTTSTAPQARSKRVRARDSAGEEQARRAAVCERVRSGLKDVAARMRAGYNARQGEQLRERKARLEAQRRAQKCR
jgi:hypothetical protein